MDLGKKGIWGLMCVLCWTVLSSYPSGSVVQAGQLTAADPNPPTIVQKTSSRSADSDLTDLPRSAPPDQEWTYHKTDDNLHPDGNEQQMMWLMNRARSNPTQEGVWLAATGDVQVEGAINFWNVDLELMKAEFKSYQKKPPAAFDARLYAAAKAHSLNLIEQDAQNHDGQVELVNQSGFVFEYFRGIVFSYARSAVHCHAGFNIDWGPNDDDTGMQPDRGHRMAVMSLDNPRTTNIVENMDANVGLAVVPCTESGKNVGPLVISGDLCKARTSAANHYNRFIVGTVWQDTNGNDQYDPGEGMDGITVTPDHGTYYAVTADSGGFAIPIITAGNYEVTFQGPGINPDVTRSADVAGQSVLLDLLYTSLAQVITEDASNITEGGARLNGSLVTHGKTTSYYFQYGTTDAYGNQTPEDTASADGAVLAAISGLSEDTVYHFRLVGTNDQGTSYGDDKTFQTIASQPTPPQAVTGHASDIKTDAAILNGSVDTHGQATDCYFQFGTSDAYGSTTTTETISVNGSINAAISGLNEDTVYHFRLVASNSQGTSYGADEIFQTDAQPPPSPPLAITGDASDVTADAASLNGSVIINGQDTEYYFQYGTTDAYGLDTTTAVVQADSDVTVIITGLAKDTVYHFRLVASNFQGTSYGADQTFQTSPFSPSGNDSDAPASSGGSGGGGCFLSTARGSKPF
jgi:hypothetical protein